MAFPLRYSFIVFYLRLHSETNLLAPLLDKQCLRINQPIELLSGQYAEQFQRKVLNNGVYRPLLDEVMSGDYYKGTSQVTIKGKKNQAWTSDITFDFNYFFRQSPEGFWGIMPVLGLESFADSLPALEEQLKDAIRLDFTRRRRMGSLHRVLPVLWFQDVEMRQQEIDLRIPTLSELENGQQREEEQWLAKVARKLEVHRKQSYGRQAELKQLVSALRGRFGRNVLLVGPSGVGKTALVWELVHQRKALGLELDIWESTASVMIKELTGDTGWQENLTQLCQELNGTDQMLFIRNLMELFEVGQYVGNEVSMAAFLRPFLSRQEINLISECTEDEFARIELRHPNYLSFFQVIRLQEPTKGLEKIILQKVSDLAGGRRVKLPVEAIREVIRLNKRYTPYSGFPGKPIRFLESMLVHYTQQNGTMQITRSAVIERFCEETGLPLFMVDPDIPMNVGELKQNFNQQLFGQQPAVDSLIDLLASVKTALTRSGKPIASLLFVGPTGVGKTELAKILSDCMFGSRERMLRFDMSEYSDPYAVQRLIGDGASDGHLTSAVRKEPFCVLLFDEIEKAYPSFYDLLLQMLGEGRLTDQRGQVVNFCSTIIIMTSNIGATDRQHSPIGLGDKNTETETGEIFLRAVRQHFRPEMYNRIDQVIPFASLGRESMRRVVSRELGLLRKREGIRHRNMDLSIEPAVEDFLAKVGFDPKYGARQLQRVIRRLLVIPLARVINSYDYDDRLQVSVSLRENEILIGVEEDPLGLDLLLEELEQINTTDYCADLNRKIKQLKDSPFYVRILSQMDILKRQQKQLKEAFWERADLVGPYTGMLKIMELTQQLEQQMDQWETDLSLSCLDLQPYDPAISEQIKEWEKSFFELKKIAYEENTGDRSCQLRIYGAQSEPIIRFYLDLLHAVEAEFEAKSVWYRDSYFKEDVTHETTNWENGQPVKKETIGPRQEFWKKDLLDQYELDLRPDEAKDGFWGAEFLIKQSCAFRFWVGEEGTQQWHLSEKDKRTFVVEVVPNESDTPLNIIRKDFYKSTPRRIIQGNVVKDNRYGVNREVNRKQKTAFWTSLLQEYFKTALNMELFRS